MGPMAPLVGAGPGPAALTGRRLAANASTRGSQPAERRLGIMMGRRGRLGIMLAPAPGPGPRGPPASQGGGWTPTDGPPAAGRTLSFGRPGTLALPIADWPPNARTRVSSPRQQWLSSPDVPLSPARPRSRSHSSFRISLAAPDLVTSTVHSTYALWPPLVAR